MTKLQEKALLISVNISQWSGRKFDKQATKSVANEYSIDARLGRYNKVLVDSAEIKKVNKAANKVRAFFYEKTLPWSTDCRIKSTNNYMEFMSELSKLASEFDQSVNNFCGLYSNLINKAQRDLNGLFNPLDYPSPSKIKEKFGVNVRVLPLPSADDFRVSLQSEEIEHLKKELEKQTSESLKQAMLSIYKKIEKLTQHMAETLADTDAKFHKTLTGNLQKVVDVLPELNLTGDAELTALGKEIKELAKVPINELKGNKAVREKQQSRLGLFQTE